MRWLIDRIRAAWQALQAVPYRPARVGVLNTGEMVVIDGLGQSQIYSAETTGLMRQALIDTEPQISELLIGIPGLMGRGVQPCGAGCTD
jgi:hypothetical protein